MEKSELKALLERKLPAKPTHDELSFHVREQQKLINYLVTTLVTQGASIIAMRKEIVEMKGDLMLHEVPRQEKRSAIIMPDTKLELN